AEGHVGRIFGRANDPELRAIRREHPGAAGPRAIDAPLHVHLHAVGYAGGLVGGHVGEDAPPDHLAAGVELDGVDVRRPACVGDVERALVRREGQPILILAGHGQRDGPVGREAIDAGVQLALGDRHAVAGIGEPETAVRLADDVVGTVEALALEAVHEHLELAARVRSAQATVAALAHDEPALEVERGAIAFAGVLAHALGRLAGHEAVELAVVATDVHERVVAVGVPQRALGEHEAGGQALGRGALEETRQAVVHGVYTPCAEVTR